MICFELVFDVSRLPSMQTVGDSGILEPRSRDSAVVFSFQVPIQNLYNTNTKLLEYIKSIKPANHELMFIIK